MRNELNDFLARFPLQPPQRRLTDPESDFIELLPEDGLRILGPAPAVEVVITKPPAKKGDPDCYLWVIDSRGLPYILERAATSRLPPDRPVKHPNLTGGRPASCGGELWFVSNSAIWVNGCSGRYMPRSEDELDTAATLFRALGYEVTSFGWDPDLQKPAVRPRNADVA